MSCSTSEQSYHITLSKRQVFQTDEIQVAECFPTFLYLSLNEVIPDYWKACGNTRFRFLQDDIKAIDHCPDAQSQARPSAPRRTALLTECVEDMMTSWNGNIFRVTGPLCGEFTGHRWIPRTKTSDAESVLSDFICQFETMKTASCHDNMRCRQ